MSVKQVCSFATSKAAEWYRWEDNSKVGMVEIASKRLNRDGRWLKKLLQDFAQKGRDRTSILQGQCSKSSHCSHLLCTGKKIKERDLGYRFKTGNHLLEMTQGKWIYFPHGSTSFCMLSVSGQNKTAQSSRQLCNVWLQKVSRDNNLNVLRPDINSS